MTEAADLDRALNLPNAVSLDDYEVTPKPVLDRLLFLERHVGDLTKLTEDLRKSLQMAYDSETRKMAVFAETMERMATRLATQQFRARLYKARWRATKGNQNHVDVTP